MGTKEDIRADSVWAIGAYFKSDLNTLLYLKKLVHGSHCKLVQCAAIYAIAREFKKDPETLAYLEGIAANDPNEQLREWAHKLLETYDAKTKMEASCNG